MARIAVGGFQHETNSFVTPDTDFAYFASHRDRPPLVRGEEVVRALSNTSFALSGFLDAIGDRHEIVPLLWTSGGAGGTVTADAYERIAGELVGRLSEAMPVDAVYLDLHGAMVSEPSRTAKASCCGACGRRSVARVPIAISLDYHANVTPEMVEDADSLVAYRTYPHVDRAETGALRGEGSLAPPRARPSGGARAAQAALPHPAQRPMHARRAVEERCCPLGGGRGRSRQSLLSCGLPALRPLLVRAGRDRPRLDQEAADAPPMRLPARSRCGRPNSPCR